MEVPTASTRIRPPNARRRAVAAGMGILAAVFGASIPTRADTDLARIYRATLEPERRLQGHDWETTRSDSWSLKRFEIQVPRQLSIRLGPSALVIGRSGTNALWAAVLPQDPGDIAAAPAGAGEHAASIWLRFHPSQVGELFPKSTVEGPGSLRALIDARRLYAHKIETSYHVNRMPAVPPRGSTIADVETKEGHRRFFVIDAKKRSVTAEPALLRKTLPKLPDGALEEGEGAKLFDEVWSAFDREYAMFGLKRGLDWRALGDLYRPLAAEARGPYDVAGAMALLLAELRDLHASVKIGDEGVWCFDRARFLNANWGGTQAVIGAIADGDQPVRWGKTRDGFGYIAVMNLLHPAIADDCDRALEELKGAKGMIFDLRFNGGGNEEIAKKVAARFHSKAVVYASHCFRNGPAHGDLGGRQERRLEPRGPWTFEKPLAVLIGERTMSSAESFASMLAMAPGARLFGARSAGSSGNPRELKLAHGIAVMLPRWLDYDHSGEPLEGRGLEPHERIDARPEQYAASDDPVVRAALRWLRKG
jgi:hypothetical protein